MTRIEVLDRDGHVAGYFLTDLHRVLFEQTFVGPGRRLRGGAGAIQGAWVPAGGVALSRGDWFVGTTAGEIVEVPDE